MKRRDCAYLAAERRLLSLPAFRTGPLHEVSEWRRLILREMLKEKRQ